MNDVTAIITEAAELIEQYNPKLAECFLSQPYRRMDLARAFARGFVKNTEDDIHPTASLVLRVAMLDNERRQLAAA